jgi:DNA-directed RNA polymerase subunit K/omega
MAEYESDIDDAFLEEMADDELEDAELRNDIDATLNAEVDYEMIDAPDDPTDAEHDEDEPPDADLDDEPQTMGDDTKSECADDNLPGESTMIASTCTTRDQVQIREMQSARDSRMPDIPTLFELGGLIISRACTLAANSTPLVPYDTFNPARIARSELIHGKALRAVLRGDTRWKWSDFTCFPRGFMDEFESTESLHEMQ